MRYGGAKKRRDGNEAEIITALRKAGLRVRQAHMPGFADLVCHSAQIGVVLLEVKSARGRLTAAQVEHRDDGWPVIIVRTVNDALAACGVSAEGSPR